MIQGIRIRNFQAHQRLFLRLEPGVTTIVGPSDVGKSSVLRALYWLCFNKPFGTAFIRDGEDQCRVRVRVDGHTIERRRTKSENLYLIDGEEYKAFGTDPPQAVSDLLNLDTINFQWQHDSLFWFPLSPGQVARELNRIVDLSTMDRTIQRISSQVRQAESELRAHTQDRDREKQTVEDLEWVGDADVDLGKIEKIQSEIDEKGSRIDSLVRSLQEGRRYQKRRELALQAVSDARIVISVGERAEESRAKLLPLQKGVDSYRGLTERIEQIRGEVDKLKKRMPKQCPLCGNTMS